MPISWNGGLSTFTPLYQGYSSSIGNVIFIDHYTTLEIYFLIIMSTTLTAASPASFTLGNFRNANDPTPGIVVTMIYWRLRTKVAIVTYPISNSWTDGGIYGVGTLLFPEGTLTPPPSPNFVTRSTTTDMDYDSETIYRVRFTNCHPINAGGLIRIVVPSGYTSLATACSVYTGIVGF